MSIKQFLDSQALSIGASFLDTHHDNGTAIHDPITGQVSYRYSAYVANQSDAKANAQCLQERLNELCEVDVRVNPHRVEYGKSKGSWKIEAYIPANVGHLLTPK